MEYVVVGWETGEVMSLKAIVDFPPGPHRGPSGPVVPSVEAPWPPQKSDPRFCEHPSKAWRWDMEDGCSGLVCDWCHLMELWCPTILPDVTGLVRVRADGRPNPDWRPQPLVERYCQAWEQLEKDLQAAARR